MAFFGYLESKAFYSEFSVPKILMIKDRELVENTELEKKAFI
jgi:hypothetical protein